MFENLGGKNVVEGLTEGKEGKVALYGISSDPGFGFSEIPKIQITGDDVAGDMPSNEACSATSI